MPFSDDPRAPGPSAGDPSASSRTGAGMASHLTAAFARLAGRPYDPATDRELIARFHQTRDESAFASLVEKHGPMVLGVCRRRLRDPHAADDAFQATFLVLAKKAGRVRWRESLGGWLYQVAVHVCRKAAARAARRAAQPLGEDAPPAPDQPPPSDLSAVLDEELRALPATYREPIVLCHLQGHTTEEAAKLLGISDGQLRGRLFRGREKLRDRLTRRGVALSVSALVVSFTAASARAVPPALGTSAVSAALGGAVPASVLSLTHEAVSAMAHTKLYLLAAVVAVGGLVGGGVLLKQARAEQPVPQAPAKPNAPPPAAPAPKDDEKEKKPAAKLDVREGVIKSVDAAANTLIVTTDEDRFDLPVEVDSKTEVVVARRAVKLGELKAGMRAEVSFQGDATAAVRLEAEWPRLTAEVGTVDAAKRVVVIKNEGQNDFTFDVSLPVAADVLVEIDGLPAGLADVPAGRKVEFEFAADKKTVAGIRVEAGTDDLAAAVKGVDAAGKSVTLTLLVVGHREERKVDLSFAVASDCQLRLGGRDVTLADLKADMPVLCRFAADRRTIAAVWAARPKPQEKDDD